MAQVFGEHYSEEVWKNNSFPETRNKVQLVGDQTTVSNEISSSSSAFPVIYWNNKSKAVLVWLFDRLASVIVQYVCSSEEAQIIAKHKAKIFLMTHNFQPKTKVLEANFEPHDCQA